MSSEEQSVPHLDQINFDAKTTNTDLDEESSFGLEAKETFKSESELASVYDVATELLRLSGNSLIYRHLSNEGNEVSIQIASAEELNQLAIENPASGMILQTETKFGLIQAFVPAAHLRKPREGVPSFYEAGIGAQELLVGGEEISVVFRANESNIQAEFAEGEAEFFRKGGPSMGTEVEGHRAQQLGSDGVRPKLVFAPELAQEVHSDDNEHDPGHGTFSELNQNVAEYLQALYQRASSEKALVSSVGTKPYFYHPEDTVVNPNGKYNAWIAGILSGVIRNTIGEAEPLVKGMLEDFSRELGYEGLEMYIHSLHPAGEGEGDLSEYDVSAGHISYSVARNEHGFPYDTELRIFQNLLAFFGSLIETRAYSGNMLAGQEFYLHGEPVGSIRAVTRRVSPTAYPMRMIPEVPNSLQEAQEQAILKGKVNIPDRGSSTTVHFGAANAHSSGRARNSVTFNKLLSIDGDISRLPEITQGMRYEVTALDAHYVNLADVQKSSALPALLMMLTRVAVADAGQKLASGEMSIFSWLEQNLGVPGLHEFASRYGDGEVLREGEELLVGRYSEGSRSKVKLLERIYEAVADRASRFETSTDSEAQGLLRAAKRSLKSIKKDIWLQDIASGFPIGMSGFEKHRQLILSQYGEGGVEEQSGVGMLAKYFSDPYAMSWGRFVSGLSNEEMRNILETAFIEPEALGLEESEFNVYLPSQESIYGLAHNLGRRGIAVANSHALPRMNGNYSSGYSLRTLERGELRAGLDQLVGYLSAKAHNKRKSE